MRSHISKRLSGLQNSDFTNPLMLMTCYTAIHDEEGSRRAARLAFERVERALAHDPTLGAALANGACALAVLGEEERAREWIERGLLLDPDNQYMRYNVACVLAAQLKDDEAAMDVLDPFFDQVNTASQLKHVEADPDLERLRDQTAVQRTCSPRPSSGWDCQAWTRMRPQCR